MITKDPFGISHAERPWATPGPRKRERIYTYDTLEQIARCQRCRKPDCTDCIGEAGAKQRSAARAKKDARFMALYQQGLTDIEIAAAMGVTRATVCYRRKRMALPPNPAKTGFCEACSSISRRVCESIGGTCPERERWGGKGQ